MKIIDISLSIDKNIPVWPKSSKPNFKLVSSHKRGDLWTETEINMNLHTGTHIDAPLHRIKRGASVDKIPLEILSGPAFVAYLPKAKSITSKELDGLRLPKGTSRLLFRTANSNLWERKQKKFQNDFVALSVDGALWLATHKIRLVGNDYLSVAPFGKDTAEVHRILLQKGIIALEGLNLSGVKPGEYQLICLPLKLTGPEAAPVRAVLVG
ncbi:MAG: cyclase family protein [Candidatus Nealsonbacteria bacterium]|nr:cyclase family protein [Candidatus Nealsonbacteria bacterium]